MLQDLRDIITIILSIAGLRDIIIVIFGILGIVTLLVVIFVILFIARWVIAPIAKSAHETLDNVRGTVSFVSETTVSPIIRIYGIIAGVRRGLAVLLGLTRWTRRR